MLAANGKRADLSKRRLDVAPIIVSQMATGGIAADLTGCNNYRPIPLIDPFNTFMVSRTTAPPARLGEIEKWICDT